MNTSSIVTASKYRQTRIDFYTNDFYGLNNDNIKPVQDLFINSSTTMTTHNKTATIEMSPVRVCARGDGEMSYQGLLSQDSFVDDDDHGNESSAYNKNDRQSTTATMTTTAEVGPAVAVTVPLSREVELVDGEMTYSFVDDHVNNVYVYRQSRPFFEQTKFKLILVGIILLLISTISIVKAPIAPMAKSTKDKTNNESEPTESTLSKQESTGDEENMFTNSLIPTEEEDVVSRPEESADNFQSFMSLEELKDAITAYCGHSTAWEHHVKYTIYG